MPTQLTCPAHAGSEDPGKTYMRTGSGAAPSSAPVPTVIDTLCFTSVLYLVPFFQKSPSVQKVFVSGISTLATENLPNPLVIVRKGFLHKFKDKLPPQPEFHLVRDLNALVLIKITSLFNVVDIGKQKFHHVHIFFSPQKPPPNMNANALKRKLYRDEGWG